MTLCRTLLYFGVRGRCSHLCSHPMTSIYREKAQRKDGTYRPGWVGATIIDGKRRKVYGRLKADVERKLRELDQAPSKVSTVTVTDVMDVFLSRDVASRDRAPSTVDSYRWSADLIVKHLGDIRMDRLTVDDVESMFDSLGLARASLVKIRSTLVQAINFSIRRGWEGRNVAQVATIPAHAARTAPRSVLGPDEARDLLTVLQGVRNGAMFGMSLLIGLRPGEAAGLWWEDIDGDVVNVTRAVRLAGGRAEVVDDLKTARSKRTIKMPSDLVGWLDRHAAEQRVERIASRAWADDRLVFASPSGNVLSPPNVRRLLAQHTSVRPNELRHSCASLLSDRGVPNEEIADLLGHTTTRMVDQTYRHRLRPVVDVAAREIWSRSS